MASEDDDPHLSAFIRQGIRGQTFVLGEGETRDDIQLNGRWIRTRDPADLGVWR